MKKFYSLLVALFAVTAVSANAMDIKFRIVVNDPAGAYVRTYLNGEYETYNIPAEGLELACTSNYGTLYFYANEGYLLSSLTKDIDGESEELISKPADNKLYSLKASDDGAVFYLNAATEDDLRTAEMTVNLTGDASLFRAQLSGTYRQLDLKEGPNTVKFIPSSESSLYILTDDAPLYQVNLDNEPVPVSDNYGQFQYNVHIYDGCVVDINTEFPDIYYTISIAAPDDCPGIIKATINGENVADISSFEAKVGSRLDLTANTDTYAIDSFIINGVERIDAFMKTWNIFVDQDYEISISGHPYATYNINLTVDNVEAVKVVVGDAWNGPVLDLVDGLNVVPISEKADKVLFIFAKDYYEISSVEDDVEGATYNEWGGYWMAQIAPDANIKINTTQMSYTMFFAWANEAWGEGYDEEIDFWGYEFKQGEGGQPVEIFAGYNECVQAGSTPFQLSVYYYNGVYAYINDVAVEPSPWDDAYFEDIRFEEYDLFKVFIGKEPKLCTVNYTVEGMVTTPNFLKDYLFEQAPGEFTILEEGTCVVYMSSDQDPIVSVTVNGVEVEEDDDMFIFNINDDCDVVVKGAASGVANVLVGEETDYNVYNLHGVKMNGIDNLPAGIYVVNGRKVVIR